MNRGDLVTVVMQGEYGKPRPALIVQSNVHGKLDSMTFLPLTSDVLAHQVFRIHIQPTTGNGLRNPSQVMTDKCSTLPLTKIGLVFGHLDPDDLLRVDRSLAVFLGLA